MILVYEFRALGFRVPPNTQKADAKYSPQLMYVKDSFDLLAGGPLCRYRLDRDRRWRDTSGHAASWLDSVHRLRADNQVVLGMHRETLNPKPSTLQPKPSTLKPKLETLEPKPKTLKPKP